MQSLQSVADEPLLRGASVAVAGDGVVTASGILELTPADQVVTVRTSISLVELRAALREVGQDLPLADLSVPWRSGTAPSPPQGGEGRGEGGNLDIPGFSAFAGGPNKDGAIPPPSPCPLPPGVERIPGGNIALVNALGQNLPHTLESQAGTWRDWVLGGVTETGTGLIGKSGARVVKSVAGYDVHRLLIGARGTLGRLREVHLRTVPAGAVPHDEVLRGDLPAEEVRAVVRVPHPDFARAMDDLNWHLADPLTATLWTAADPRWPRSKVWLPFGPFVVDPGTARLMRRAKTIFDPEGVLPPLEIEER